MKEAGRPRAVALLPARGGSKRVPNKNVRRLGPHPLIAYTIRPAIESGVFDAVVVSTDSRETAEIARHYGAEVPFLRPAAFAGDLSPDIEWVEHALATLEAMGRPYDCFSILRPTSPFRTAATIDETDAASGVWRVEQVIDDPAGDHDWRIRGEVDLDASAEEGYAVVTVTEVVRL